MRTEQRIGRPFAIDYRLQRALDSSVLQFPDGSQHHPTHGSLIAPPRTLDGTSHFQLSVEIDRESISAGLLEQNLKPESASIFVIASIDRLRRSAVVSETRLSDLRSQVLTIDLQTGPKWVLEAALNARITISAYLCLNENLDPRPLQPYLRSAWLSRSKFEVGVADPDYTVTIQPLTEEQYKIGVPKGAYSWIEIKGDVTESTASEFKLTVFLDADVFASLKQYESSPASMNAQAKLEALVVECLLRRVVIDSKSSGLNPEDWTDLERMDSPPVMVSIVKNIARRASKDPANFFNLLLTDTEMAMSYVGKALKLAKQDIELLKPVSEEVD